MLIKQRWAVLIAVDGLSSRHLDSIHAAARADVPRWRAWKQVIQKYGWRFLSVGTQRKVERLLEYDSDAFLTIEITDFDRGQAGRVPHRQPGRVEVEVGGTTTDQLTMAFDSMEELESTLENIDEVLLPGNPDIPC